MNIRHLDATVLEVAEQAASTGGRVTAVRYLKDRDSHRMVRVRITAGPSLDNAGDEADSIAPYFLKAR